MLCGAEFFPLSTALASLKTWVTLLSRRLSLPLVARPRWRRKFFRPLQSISLFAVYLSCTAWMSPSC